MKKAAFKTVRLLFLLVGLSLFAGMIHKTGWHSIQSQIETFGWPLLPIFGIGFLWYACYTAAWRQILKQQGAFIPFWNLFRTKIAGEMVNTMTPANFLGGDSMRVYLLHRHTDATLLAASVVVDRTVNSMAIVAVIFAGAITAFLALPGLPVEVSVGTPLFLLATTTLIFFLFLKQKKGLFASLLRLAKRLHIAPKRATKYLAKAGELDAKILLLYQQSHRAFWSALALHIFGRLLGIGEIYAIGKMVEPAFTLTIALLLATLAPVINMVFTFIPGALGVMEGAYSAALYLLGINPALGLTIQIVKRIRATLWMGLGFFFHHVLQEKSHQRR